MFTRLTVSLSREERSALQRSAERNLRPLREEARAILRRALRQELRTLSTEDRPALQEVRQP